MCDQDTNINFVSIVGREKPQIISVKEFVTGEFYFDGNTFFANVKALLVRLVVGNRHFFLPATRFEGSHQR